MKLPAQVELLPPGADVYVIEERPNPSTDYFVAPACAGEGRRLHRCRFDEVPPAAPLAGAVVVFVRYIPPLWRRKVTAERAQLAGLVFFMDDDLLDPMAWASMPWRYRYKLYRQAARHGGWLQQQRAQLWVSTPWLQQKYQAWTPLRVEPRPLPVASGVRRVFYHGSASHLAEIRWLRPIIEEVQRRDPLVVFEVIGGQDIYRLYQGLPRVSVVHPMRWPAYEAFLDQPGRHIGLAPLLELPFNRARSCTKFFDITRAGGVGVYAQAGVCGSFVRNGVDGIVLPMDPQQWVEGILRLARAPQLRRALLRAARTRVAGIGEPPPVLHVK